MLRFPLTELLNEQECYSFLLNLLHPEGLCCPNGHQLPPNQAPHSRRRAPILKYRCRACGQVFHLFTRTILSGIHYNCQIIVLLLRGFCQGHTSRHLSEEMSLDYSTVLKWRHKIQGLALKSRPTDPLDDEETEGDEMFQNAGEKGTPHQDPDDPPRRRANKRRGRGTKDNDRPPILGIVGRRSQQLRLRVCQNTQQVTIQPYF